MDLGEAFLSLPGQSGSSNFHVAREAVGSRVSLTPLLNEYRQNADAERDSSSDTSSEYILKQNPRLNGHKRKFSPRKQLVRLLGTGFIRFFITGVLIAGTYLTVWLYKAKPIMSKEVDQVRFNYFTTGLSMLLGMSIASGLKQVAVDVRWLILSRRSRPLSEVDGILNASSLTNLLHIAISAVKKGKLGKIVPLLIWILMNILGQVIVALLAFTYSLSPVIIPSPPETGPVSTTDLSSFAIKFAEKGDSTSVSFLQANQLAAHTYGEMSLTYTLSQTNNVDFSKNPVEPNTLHDGSNMHYWAGPNYYQYVFQQSSCNSDSPIGSFYSNRSIAASSTCTMFVVTDGANGLMNNFEYQSDTGKMQTGNFQLVQPNSTTYYTNADAIDCGDRCANVCAFENNSTAGFYYECQVTLSNVTNVYDPSHVISDHTARTAAGSIALQGYQSNRQDAQYQAYPERFSYGSWLGGDNVSMANRMSQFAIGAIVGADQNNPPISQNLTGSMPRQGVILTIDKVALFHTILLTIASVQLILFIGGACLANRVVVLDENYIAIANLLKPLLEDMKDGSLLDGHEICDVLGKDTRVAYGSALRDSEKERIQYVRLGSDGTQRRFLAGWYN